MSRQIITPFALLVLLAAPLLIQGCSDDNPTNAPLPPTRAVIIQPVAGDTTLFADEAVQLEGEGYMTTGQPVYPNRLAWYLGAVADTNFIATGFTPLVELESGDHTIFLVAHESINLSATTSVTFTVREPANWDPVATILEPVDGEDFLPAHVITVLRGLATDVEDGDLDGDAVVWTSDIQGILGEGPDLDVALIPGEHEIVLTATDTGGQTDADTVRVVARHRPAAPVVDGEFFFRASNFTEFCPSKAITQLIGDCRIDVHDDPDRADMYIDEMAGSISCDTADVCFLQGELTQGNIRVVATGDHASGGTVRLEFSLYVSSPTTVEGLVRGIETPASGPACIYRSWVRMTLKTD